MANNPILFCYLTAPYQEDLAVKGFENEFTEQHVYKGVQVTVEYAIKKDENYQYISVRWIKKDKKAQRVSQLDQFALMI